MIPGYVFSKSVYMTPINEDHLSTRSLTPQTGILSFTRVQYTSHQVIHDSKHHSQGT